MEIHQDGERYKISFVDMTEEDENGQRTEIKRIDSRKGEYLTSELLKKTSNYERDKGEVWIVAMTLLISY